MAKSSHPSIAPDARKVLAEADAHSRALKTAPCALIAAEYKPKTDTFVFTLRDKSQLVIPRGSIGVEAIVKAEPKHLRRIEIDEFCTHVWLPDLDEGVNPVGMFARKLNPALQAERGRKGGSKKSAAKSRAARKNGASGGRPRRKAAKLA